MKHHNRQSELRYHLWQEAVKESYDTIYARRRDAGLYVRLYMSCRHINSTSLQINLAFICFILRLQICLTVIEYHNYFAAS